ncbi:MAG: ABC transporter permease, partial [Leptospiraceae bacterium]|nr:ABC transporter permease [Leptospiraceae bacterium]
MLSKLLYYFDLVLVLTLKEIKVRYKNSLLGYLWSVMNPIIFSLVFYFAFKKVLKTPLENFHLYLIVGLFPWQWFSDSTITANHSLLHNAQ